MAPTTRRRFLAAAAATAALPLVATPPSAAAGDPPASAEQALLAIVRLRYKFLTEDQLKVVLRNLQVGLAAGDILKRVSLDAVDEPATIFVADVAE